MHLNAIGRLRKSMGKNQMQIIINLFIAIEALRKSMGKNQMQKNINLFIPI